MSDKYKLTDETMEWYEHTLYRIEALRDFGNVKAGDKGGWVESEANLSHKGECWVYDNAQVYDNAEVYGNAKVYGDARVSGNATIYGDAKVYDDAKVYGNACVNSLIPVSDTAEITE